MLLDKVVEHLLVLPGDGVGEVLDWQASFTDYVAYQEQQEQEQQQQQQQKQQQQQQPVESKSGIEAPTGKADAAAPSQKGAKPLSNFERQNLERFEAEIEAITAKQAELQSQVDTFDSSRNGYSELTAWSEEMDALGEKLEEAELKWLELADRAEL